MESENSLHIILLIILPVLFVIVITITILFKRRIKMHATHDGVEHGYLYLFAVNQTINYDQTTETSTEESYHRIIIQPW